MILCSEGRYKSSPKPISKTIGANKAISLNIKQTLCVAKLFQLGNEYKIDWSIAMKHCRYCICIAMT